MYFFAQIRYDVYIISRLEDVAASMHINGEIDL